MRINANQLSRQLASVPLAPFWLVAGDQPLLVGEAADSIRARARELGFAEREIFFVEPRFDWGPVLGASQALSLFATQRLLEIRMPSPRPGVEGGKLLADMAASPPPDTVVLVTTGRLERESLASAWFKALEKHAVVVQAWPVEIGQLPDWVAARARRHGIVLDAAGSRLLAERVEGNLLAAHQEIEKLALTHGPGEMGEDEVAEAVADNARYGVFQLGDAALAGDPVRALRILEGLRGEGAEPTLVLWVLAREIRALARARPGRGGATGYSGQSGRRAEILDAAARRIGASRVTPLVRQAARTDRSIKGLGDGDPWDELACLVAGLAGAAVLPAGNG
jgi:DNA polymerase-3 subunit delta